MKIKATFLTLAILCCSLGIVSAQELDENESLFKALDKNQDGSISLSEAGQKHQTLFSRLLTKGDQNADKKLTLIEFKISMREDAPATISRFTGRGGAGRGPQMMQANPTELFKRLDKNQDGKIVKDEFPADRQAGFVRMLAQFDKDSDKAISLKEFQSVNSRPGNPNSPQKGTPEKKPTTPNKKPASPPTARQPGNPATASSAEMVKRIMSLDKNKDGKLTKAEAPEKMKQRFAFMDNNKDGFLDTKELTSAMERFQKMRAGSANPQRKKPNPQK